MKASFLAVLAASVSLSASAAASASTSTSATSSPIPPFSGDPFEKHTLEAKGIKASWVPYGARLTNLWVPDRHGGMQDVIMGYDNASDYVYPRNFFGAVVGRYANRIKNGTFSIGSHTYHSPLNEDNRDTLHGGTVGYDERNWTIVKKTSDSITFMMYDEAFEGFPGDVLNIATYTLTDEPAFYSRMTSIPTQNVTTPIMLANHIYWNLGAFVNKEATTVLNETLWMPYAKRWVNIDGWEVPTGNISVVKGTPLDFTEPKQIGKDIYKTVNGCGTGCTGYDDAFIMDRPRYSYYGDPGLTLLEMSSPATGIKMKLETNQQSLQVYTCNVVTSPATIKAKKDQQHGNGNTTYDKYGCTVIETQDVGLPVSLFSVLFSPLPVFLPSVFWFFFSLSLSFLPPLQVEEDRKKEGKTERE